MTSPAAQPDGRGDVYQRERLDLACAVRLRRPGTGRRHCPRSAQPGASVAGPIAGGARLRMRSPPHLYQRGRAGRPESHGPRPRGDRRRVGNPVFKAPRGGAPKKGSPITCKFRPPGEDSVPPLSGLLRPCLEASDSLFAQILQDRAAGLVGYVLAQPTHTPMDELHERAQLDPTWIGGVTGYRRLTP